MNHYPHRVGDFDAATRHLSRLERAIYRDMRDRYCLTESPLDGSDFDLLARRLLCVTPEDIAALQFVLDEFFELTSDGLWVNHECDQIIAAYRAQQAGNGVVKSNEKDRKARSRSRRSAMFSALRGVGVVLPYDTKMAELYRLCKAHQLHISEDAPVTEHAVTGDVTGHGQVTDSHALGTGKPKPKPKPILKETSSPKDDGDATPVQPAADTVPKSAGDWAIRFGQEFGVEVDPLDARDRKKFWPIAAAWVSAGVTLGQMRAAVQRARDEATEGIAYLPAYVDRVLASMSAPPVESRAEAAARSRMAEAAPLAAARGPSTAPPVAMGDGYQFFKDQAAGVRALPPVEAAHA